MDSHCLDLRTLQAALGGDIAGGQVLCPGPNHSKRDRSLAVKPTASGVLVYSHAGDDWRDCRDYVHAHLGLPTWQPGNHRHQINVSVKWTDPEPERWRTDRAKAIWDDGREPRGTAAEEYLSARSLRLPSELCGSVLRFHARCLWCNELVPCLIAAFTSIADDTITAIHRIRLDRPERWPKTERKMFGAVAGSAVKLDPPGQRLAIAEGIESALSCSTAWIWRNLGAGFCPKVHADRWRQGTDNSR